MECERAHVRSFATPIHTFRSFAILHHRHEAKGTKELNHSHTSTAIVLTPLGCTAPDTPVSVAVQPSVPASRFSLVDRGAPSPAGYDGGARCWICLGRIVLQKAILVVAVPGPRAACKHCTTRSTAITSCIHRAATANKASACPTQPTGLGSAGCGGCSSA